jgi:hypothetical protein
MNELAEVVARAIPPLFFHYIIVVFVVGLILCVCVLKFKYLYWYEQPLTFRFTVQRFFRGGVGHHRTTIMNPLSLGTRCYNAVVYPFLHHVNHDTVRVYRGNDEDSPPPFERISQLLQQRGTNNGGGGGIVHKNAGLIACDSSDTLRLLLSQDTFGLSAFIGVFVDKAMTATATATASDRIIKGVSVLTPRIMISFDSSIATSSYKSVSIYMSEYLAWNTYMMIERESLTLIETTEYIQKSREIAGEQTLYRYSEIPWFVIPFSTVYSYLFTPPPQSIQNSIIRSGITIVPVSSANFALFYSFVNESTRDFRCCILNELTQLQSLVDHKLYRIYMLVLNEVRVIAVYVFTRSAMPRLLLNHSTTRDRLLKTAPNKKKRTKGNRISDLHDHVSKTSTALVKYLPPVLPPRYDAFGKRITAPPNTKTHEMDPTALFPSSSVSGHTVIRLISSIQHKSLCEASDFLTGFQRVCSIEMSKNGKSGYGAVMIDTIAHNYRIIDHLIAKESLSWPLISQDKWYYILYNAIIREETLCKDILMV